ncbi:MAG: zinc ribbon domain-containing protein [Gallionellaceae bacterium]|jgi:putative FmdB family regulatory protein
MPIYDYRCRDCNKTFDLLVRTDTVPLCPACTSENLEKLVSVLAPHGKTADILKQARSQAAREGHFSNYKKSELKR